jgi:hypothetical protein
MKKMLKEAKVDKTVSKKKTETAAASPWIPECVVLCSHDLASKFTEAVSSLQTRMLTAIVEITHATTRDDRDACEAGLWGFSEIGSLCNGRPLRRHCA